MALTDAALNDPGLIINKAQAGEEPAFVVTLDKYTRIRFVFTYDLISGAGFWFFIDYLDADGEWQEYSTERISPPAEWVELLALPK